MLKRGQVSGLTWPLSENMTDEELEAEFYPSTAKQYKIPPKDSSKQGMTESGNTYADATEQAPEASSGRAHYLGQADLRIRNI